MQPSTINTKRCPLKRELELRERILKNQLLWVRLCASLMACVLSMPAFAQSSQTGAPSAFPSPSLTGGQTGDDSTMQSPGGALSTAGTDGNSGSGTLADSSRAVSGTMGTLTALSTDQILKVLQEQPDAIVELKSLISDQAQQQGISLQPDAISDDMLYSRISSSPELRANITTFFRARGYVSSSQLDSFASNGGDDSELMNLADPRSMNPDASAIQEAMIARSGNGQGQSGAGNGGAFGPPQTGSNRSISTSRTQRSDSPSQAAAEPPVLHRTAPYNLMAMRDLYTQLSDQTKPLKRFGSEVFLRHDTSLQAQAVASGRDLSLDVPAGPDYVVGAGDGLTIALWGGVSQSLTRVVDREGRVQLPEVAAVQVAGLTLARVQDVITEALKSQFRNEQVAVTVSRLRSIRVYVVGDVQRPGAYDVSSLATSLNALYAAGGPTNIGSLRTLRHYRGKQLIGEIDLYDFLLHGIMTEDRMQAGDTLQVPPAGPQIAVNGAVKRPAIYELRPADPHQAETLASILEDAGGTTVAAELQHIVVERIDANQHRETISLDMPEAVTPEDKRKAVAEFRVKDGDRIHVSSILPYSQRIVYLEGHVSRPGRTSYRDGMHLSDILHSYQDLLPEPADKGEIVRLVAPDLHPETINFNVPDVLIGNDNPALMPFDTVRVYGRYEADAPRVTVGGEVLRPGTYALSASMTAAQLVRMAGGFKRDALLSNADLTSYTVVNGTKVSSDRTSVRIGDAVLHADKTADVPLKPGDVLTVHQITGWGDIGSSIRLEGEVAHPGVYGIQQGERLSSILRRAGGMRDTSYPEGAVLLRDEVRHLEEKSRDELIRQIETSATAARMRPNLGPGDSSSTIQLIAAQQDEVLSRLKSQPPSGRLVIHIGNDIASWENTPADIEVRTGDVLRVPKKPGFVLVSGQVYNASAITFTPDKTAGWYLRRAGGATEIANTKDIFVIRANGSVIGRRSGNWLDHDVLATRLEPGDVVVVPQKIIGASVFWRNLLTVAQVSSSIAITAAVAGLL
jgi:protein involved in polysaccharide export with SLBB domain